MSRLASQSAPAARRWNHGRYRAEALRLTLDRILSRVSESSAVAIALPDGRPLHARAHDPVDLATLPHAALQCAQYLRLRDGEVAVLNEPFAGGTRLPNVTFATAVAFAGRGDPDVLLALRVRFMPRLALDEKLEHEGVRIPPTPLGTVTAPNEALLAAISSHPLAPHGFGAAAMRAIADLRALAERLRAAARDPGSELRATSFEPYLADAAEIFHERVARLPLGRTLASETFESGETLKLALEVREDKVTFDFAGTDSSALLQLTDRAAFGACFAAVCRAAQAPIEANAGAFASVEVRSVRGTMVNAKAPTGLGRGMADLATAVSELALRALAQNRASLKSAASARGFSRWQLVFDDGRALYDGAFGGSGASAEGVGLASSALEWRRGDALASIERAERACPILFQARAPRPKSRGGGLQEGGAGESISFSVLEPATFSWSLRHAGGRTPGTDGGKSGAMADIAIVRKAGEGKRETLAATGELRLQAGDVVTIRTAGGGGFGEKASAAKEEEE